MTWINEATLLFLLPLALAVLGGVVVGIAQQKNSPNRVERNGLQDKYGKHIIAQGKNLSRAKES